MHCKHAAARTSAVFDDPHLLPAAGLVSVMALAGRAGLSDPPPISCTRTARAG